MSPKREDEESVEVKDPSIKSEDESAPAAVPDATRKQAAKRRTKTGCLTCRKRRIKCGEEKPFCKNCVKSKRDCAGYVQPLVYNNKGRKDPNSGDQLSLQEQETTPTINLRWQTEQPYSGSHNVFTQADGPSPYQQLPFSASYHAISHLPQNAPHPPGRAQDHGNQRWQGRQPLLSQPGPEAFNSLDQYAPSFDLSGTLAEDAQAFLPFDPQMPAQPMYSAGYPQSATMQTPVSAFSSSSHFYPTEHPNTAQHQQRAASFGQYGAHGGLQHLSYAPVMASGLATVAAAGSHHHDEEYEDPDDPFDVDMEDPDLSYYDAANNLTDILGRSGQADFQAAKLYIPRRTEYKAVATYGLPITKSPLRDERNEQIFCHFVEITSNTMSIFERHHFSPIAAPARTLWNFTIPALALGHAALAHAMLALGALHLAKLNNTSENPAIKHFTYAVRRVGRLLGLPQRRHEIRTLATVMLLGYYEVVAGDHSRWNLHLSGAARLVLEHDYAGLTRTARRMRHGAKARLSQWTAQFALTEENYARVAGIPLALLDDADWEVDQALISRLLGVRVDYDHQYQPNFSLRATTSTLSEKDVEELKTKMSLRWWYCKQDVFQSMVSGDPPLMALENWRYCPPRGQFGRADAPYATFDHLLLVMARLCDFGGKDRRRKQKAVAAQGGQWRPPPWLFGPQRPPIPPGGHGAPGSSKPSPVSSAGQAPASAKPGGAQDGPRPTPPSANEGRARQSRPGAPGGTVPGPQQGASPPMLGMMPPPSEPPQLDSAFHSMDASIKDPAFAVVREHKESSPPTNLEDDTARAMAEYEEITRAFDLFAQSLGPDFEALNDSGNPISSPFGPALVYKNAAIACMWACYYVARISLQRLHPEMPPAAMVAAGVTAHLTHDYAQTVGKICAGLYATQQYGQTGALDPSFAGALMESTFFLLFAGIQYTDAAQRGWTISKLKDVERRCGWRTSGAIAAGCETAWERMAQAGRGPPYERRRDVRNKDSRVSGITTRSDNSSPQSGQHSDAVADQHESEFVNHDRSLIDRSSSTRVHWALGLLSVEEDIKKMALDND
ncbi:hypothetical protein G647_09620 [Cladophialophora carrionii CBS 160.54]|uniref:Zn(2)-C6 fungal-type domain-containing protein n=1 Tax=Cladophialophora carrionii CBS 160.54 TaxID=1279043 RepID=V9DKP9_9EURO|nr:uncharacterized protein G647_09620 [Cladophialophora carrionii CBS 160.54]ETI27430.1 hypothetical protein G647_09620 [Cladophialophora carrionii CBS 160.54]